MTCIEAAWETSPGVFAGVRLERVFNACFADKWHTRLRGGVDEPLYQPAQGSDDHHLLSYRADYFASALHEVAHWCIAGEQRRQLPDFGYWYAPEGRSVSQQQAFEAVEAKPQALEWFFSRACGYRFQVSADNLELASQQVLDIPGFQRAVLNAARLWQSQGLPERAALFYGALCEEFGTTVGADQQRFFLADLL
jgi:elongation factor P hydroxylase